LITLLLGLVAVASAIEVDRSGVLVKELHSFVGGDEFCVAISHDEAIYNVKGQLLGERTMSVGVRFDVSPDFLVLVNGEPAVVGMQEIQVAAMIKETDAPGQHPFSSTIQVGVQVFVAYRETYVDGQQAREVIIQERVIEVEGKKVWQATARQQSVIVRGDGFVAHQSVTDIEILGQVVEDKAPQDESEVIVDKAPSDEPEIVDDEVVSKPEEPYYIQPEIADDSQLGVATSTAQRHTLADCKAKIMAFVDSLHGWYRVLFFFSFGFLFGAFLVCINQCMTFSTKRYARVVVTTYAKVYEDEKAAAKADLIASQV